MKSWAHNALKMRIPVHYIDAHAIDRTSDITSVLSKSKITQAQMVDPEDDYLLRRVSTACLNSKIKLEVLPDPHFITSPDSIDRFFDGKKKLFFTQFYIEQRKRHQILLDEKGLPLGGKWSFDTENRKKLPKNIELPEVKRSKESSFAQEAFQYVSKQFPDAPGDDKPLVFPSNRKDALACLSDFLRERLHQFGDYEDAIVAKEAFLFHSVLTPTLNIGLISPTEIITQAIAKAEEVPLNSLEGFVRQILGWREYMRAVYRKRGSAQRTTNFWRHQRKIPASFYDGTTGIVPVDTVIQRVMRYGYCHHIERLMILGNFFLLCEFHPDEIYRWFMELFVDAYDWVMVPNVYGMSQHADGGTITTKPYLSGSSYVLKMSDFKKGDWCPIWDALYWRFIFKNREFFEKNPRMSVMTSQLDKMGEKLKTHLRISEEYLLSL